MSLLGAVVCALALLSGARAQQPTQPAVPPTRPLPPSENQTKPQNSDQGGYAIRRDVNLVVLRVAVLDDRGKFVPGIPKEDFKLFENKVEQTLSVFRQEDVPVSMGLVVDNSGSMREKRPQVNAAALTLVKLSNPQDEAFVVNFNDEFYLDTVHDFTSDINELKDALERIDSRGSTALYDAMIGSIDHLKKGTRDKKVLIIVTDGVDNSSRRTLANAIQEAQRADTLVYAIGLFSDEDIRHNRSEMKKARSALEEMASATGGKAYFPENVSDTEAICTQIAHDIRDQYTLGYYSTNQAQDGTFRNVQVEVDAPKTYGKLQVRTRTGYYARRSQAEGPSAGVPSGN